MGRQQVIEVEQMEDGSIVLYSYGRMDVAQTGRAWSEIMRAMHRYRTKRLTLDFSHVSGIDTAGVAMVRNLEDLCSAGGIDLSCVNLPDSVRDYLHYTRGRSSGNGEAQHRITRGFISRYGKLIADRVEGGLVLVRLLGDLVVALARSIRHPRLLRFGEMLYRLQLVGSEAVLLVAALSALMGMIMVFQGITTMKEMGAAIYIADMVAIAVTREMAPLLTGVILAGRSGASFAAEIGTMKVNEQIDALTVMDLDIASYLVVPRVVALAIAGPLLIILADAAGILGGLFASLALLDYPAVAFLSEVRRTMHAGDIYRGLIKGAVFSILIGLTGCFCGLRTSASANSVGIQTTFAVVSGILLVVLADAALAAVFHLYGWL